MKNRQITPEYLFQVIGELTVENRVLREEKMQLQKEKLEVKPEKKEEK